MKSLVLLPLVIAGAYVAICALYYLQQERLLFIRGPAVTPPEHPRIRPVEHRVGGLALRGFEVSAAHGGNERILLYFGGNAEDVAYSAFPMLRFEAWTVYLLNYRGYGASEGSPSESALRADARAHFDWLRQRHPAATFAIMGRSLGSALALELGATRDIDGLVLISPFTSIRDVARHHFPWLPVGPLLKHPFECVAHANAIAMETLIIAAEHDEVIPRTLTVALREALGAPSELHIVPDTHHNSVMAQPFPWERIERYLSALRRQRALR